MTDPPAIHPERCLWCGAEIGPSSRRLGGRTVCGVCGAATTDPLPSPDELDRAYGDWYRPTQGGRFAGPGDRILERTRGALARRIDAIAPAGAVLDVGAGSGWLVDALTRRGRRVLGLERNVHRPDFRDSSVTDVEGEWAAVVYWHSLEHLPDAGAAIEATATLLAPGGLLIVAVPNSTSLQAEMFGDRWLHLDLPRHLVHLNTAALLDRIEELGLEVHRVSGVRGGQVVIGWLHGLVGSLPGRLDLYGALRRDAARHTQLSNPRRGLSITAAVALFPVALGCAAWEIATGRSGTVYVEARAPLRRPTSSRTT